MTNLEQQIENATISLQNSQREIQSPSELHLAQAVASCILALEIISEELSNNPPGQ